MHCISILPFLFDIVFEVRFVFSIAENEHQYKAIASFKATNPGEISFSEDNILTVIEKTERGRLICIFLFYQ